MVKRVRIGGSLARYEEGFRARLDELGYASSSAGDQVRLFADLSGWLAREGLDAEGLEYEAVDRFLVARRAQGRRTHLTTRALGPLLVYLQDLGVAPLGSASPPSTAAAQLLETFRRYLAQERGLAPGTVRNYVDAARLFIAGLPNPNDPDLEGLSASEVTGFVLGLARAHARGGPRSAKNLGTATTGLRSLLGLLFLQGRIPLPLADAVPSPARWKGSSLPRAVDACTIAALLDGCDHTRAVGRRDFAILTLLVRLGLRAGEVAALLLDDVDWAGGDLLVRGKANRERRLPIPGDVGEAVVDYLSEGRPRSACRQVFLRALAPHVEMTPGAVGMVVALACDRAGLPRMGAHRLRHTAATEMLRHGAPLSEIGEVLGHARVETSAIYAKVDRTALSTLAKPWPGGQS